MLSQVLYNVKLGRSAAGTVASQPVHPIFARFLAFLFFSSMMAEDRISVPAATDVTETCPKLRVGPEDMKTVYHLQKGGRLTVVQRSDNTVTYDLLHPDGRRVYLDKPKDGSVLIITDTNGVPVKSMGCKN